MIIMRRRMMGLSDYGTSDVTVYVNGRNGVANRVLTDNPNFSLSSVSSMWVDGVEMIPTKTVVFDDEDEHSIHFQFVGASVPAYTFYGCDELVCVTLGQSIEGIGDYALYGTVGVGCLVVYGSALPLTGVCSFGDPSDANTMCCSGYGQSVARVYAKREVYETLTGGWKDLEACAAFKPLLVEHPFTVSASKAVSFGSSNLQYLGSKNVFTFGTWQGEMYGKNGGNETAPASRGQSVQLIDLFGWACSGGDYAGYHRHWKPYDCVYYSGGSSFAYYYGIVYGSQNYSYSLDGTGADWGVANRLPSEQVRSGWRTLTADEWNYLWATRSNATALRAKGKVSDVKGLILLPDDWVLPEGASLVTDASGTTTFASNTLNDGEWAVLEDAGAIFLPAAGYRSAVSANSATVTADDYTGSGVPTVGDADHSGNPVGSYWSTTYIGSQAYRFYFANASTTTRNAAARYTGYSVRLVRDRV